MTTGFFSFFFFFFSPSKTVYHCITQICLCPTLSLSRKPEHHLYWYSWKKLLKLFILKNLFLVRAKPLHSKRMCLTMQSFWHVKLCGCCSCLSIKEWPRSFYFFPTALLVSFVLTSYNNFIFVYSDQIPGKEWKDVILRPPETADLWIPNHRDPRDVYMEKIFYPGCFSVQDIVRALNVSNKYMAPFFFFFFFFFFFLSTSFCEKQWSC